MNTLDSILNRRAAYPSVESPSGRRKDGERGGFWVLHNQPCRSFPAFTLIELLVVITIIGLLASLLLPALSKTKQKALQAKCTSNLKQFAYALSMYTLDHNERLPGPAWLGMFFTYRYDPPLHNGSIVAYLTDYLALPPPDSLVRTAAVTICPAAAQRFPRKIPNPPLYVPIAYFSPSVITNRAGPSPEVVFHPFGRPNNPYADTKKISAIRRPSDSWALTDCDRQFLTGLGISAATYIDYIPVEPVHGSKQPAIRNALYFDWSVRSRRTPY